MLIQKRSTLTGKINVREIPITEAQLNLLGVSTTPIQRLFPHLSADDREFLMTGATPEEWDATFPEVEED